MEISESVDQLFEAILTLKNKEECYKFFADACTPKEIQTIAQRYMVAKMLVMVDHHGLEPRTDRL